MVLFGPSNRLIKQVEVTSDEVLDDRLISQHKCFNRTIGGIDKVFCTFCIRKPIDRIGDINGLQSHHWGRINSLECVVRRH